ncbi:MAG: hypothetical protein V1727_06065 [Candidatus Omnitrophota bacterium]
MVKSKNGGNRDGLGVYEMVRLALVHPLYFSFMKLAIRAHLTGLVKKVLDIH